jgi:ferritin-like protein
MATTRNAAQGILADDNAEDRTKIIELLIKGYWMEVETVMSYIANSINPDGVRAQEIIESLTIIRETEEIDPVTQDMVIAILRDEEGHRRLFEGYLREYEAEGLA